MDWNGKFKDIHINMPNLLLTKGSKTLKVGSKITKWNQVSIHKTKQ